MSNKSTDFIVKKPAPTGSKSKSVTPVSNSSVSTSYKANSYKERYGYGQKKVFKGNMLYDFDLLNDVIDLYDDCVITKLPGGKYIEVFYDGEDFKYSADSTTEGSKTNNVFKYLTQYIYPELSDLINRYFSGLPCHFYAILGRQGFHIYDIFINENFIDIEDIENIVKDYSKKVKTPEKIYSGIYLEANEIIERKSFLIRPMYDSVDTEDHFVAKQNIS